MSEIKLISPLLDHFAVGSPISEHNGVRCYPAMRKDSDIKYIVKVISIPASQVQLHAFLLTGAYKNEEEAKTYFSQLAQGVQNEAETLLQLSKLEGFLPLESCQVVEKDDEVGYDVYLLTTYKRTLQRHFRSKPMTYLAAINLGLDLCASLAVCRQTGHLYANLKPSNIFISDDNEYRIGDLGFLKLNGLKYATLPDRYRSQYTAPELADPFAEISTTVDIYAAGLILYQAYNGGVLPFEGSAPSDPLPPPEYADYEIAEIILKACAPNPADRWEDPIKMGQALVSYMQRNGVNDTPIIPPVPEEPQAAEDEVQPFEEETDALCTGIPFEVADEAGQMMIEQLIDYDSIMQPSEEVSFKPAEDTSLESEEAAQPDEEFAVSEDDPANLSFLDELVNDETAPQEEMADQIVYSELSEDANSILALADDLIAHELPAPAVAPEPIDVPIPDPIILEAEEAPPEQSNAAGQEDSPSTQAEINQKPKEDPQPAPDDTNDTSEKGTPVVVPVAVDADLVQERSTPEAAEDKGVAPETDDKTTADDLAAPEDDAQDVTDEAVAAIDVAIANSSESTIATLDNNAVEFPEDPTEDLPPELTVLPPNDEPDKQKDPDLPEEDRPKKKIAGKILAAVLLLIIIASIAVGGYIFYKEYYIKTIDNIIIEHYDDTVTVRVTTSADPQLITVVCTSERGDRFTSRLTNGTATFTDLNVKENTVYYITLEIDGFHVIQDKKGNPIKEQFSTERKTKIKAFNCITGTKEGSVVLSFSVEYSTKSEASEMKDWIITCSTDNEAPRTCEFTGQTVTIEGLTVGKTYTFTLDSAEDSNVVGETQIQYKVTELIYAQNLSIVDRSTEDLTVTWDDPEGMDVPQWTVVCYNEDYGYRESIITEGNSAVFSGIDPTQLYNVEVTAAGMTNPSICYITANSQKITSATGTPHVTYMDIAWEYDGPEPTADWVLTYTIDNRTDENIAPTAGSTGRIENIVPGATYYFKLKLSDGTTILNDSFTAEVPEPSEFVGFSVTAGNIKFEMCVAPDKQNWTNKDVAKSDFTSTFQVGQKAGFTMRLNKKYGISQDTVITMYVIRDSEGNLISYDTTSSGWTPMWFQFNGELTIPTMPQTPGEYTIEIYFNGTYVHKQSFTITE